MKIVCDGIGHHTQILDDDGRDLGRHLLCNKATIVLEVGCAARVTLECFSKVDLDLGKVTIKTIKVSPQPPVLPGSPYGDYSKESSIWLIDWWDVLSGNRRTRRLIWKALGDYEGGGVSEYT